MVMRQLFLGLGLCVAACQHVPEAQAAPPTSPYVHHKISAAGYDVTPLPPAEVARLAKGLTQEQRNVLLKAGTEPPFCGGLLENKKSGVYVSALGGLPLFRSSAKFESGTGWPSFFAPFDPDHVIEKPDNSGGMERVEILDARSGGHLGHVFDDGPRPTGRRYCLNSAALIFIPDGQPLPPQSQPVNLQKAYFAGGCFWGVEDIMQRTPGVIEATSGYMGGRKARPGYHEVSSGDTGHAESVEVLFDADRVSYRHLLEVLFAKIDPTTLNQQGPDVGTQYRSVVFAADAEQKRTAETFLRELSKQPRLAGRSIVTTVEAAKPFWPAEEYHQDYHEKHGGTCEL